MHRMESGGSGLSGLNSCRLSSWRSACLGTPGYRDGASASGGSGWMRLEGEIEPSNRALYVRRMVELLPWTDLRLSKSLSRTSRLSNTLQHRPAPIANIDLGNESGQRVLVRMRTTYLVQFRELVRGRIVMSLIIIRVAMITQVGTNVLAHHSPLAPSCSLARRRSFLSTVASSSTSSLCYTDPSTSVAPQGVGSAHVG